jgi:hypothetical protein
MTESFLVSIIITLIAAALIGGTVMRFMSTADEKSAESLCRDSIALRAKTAFNYNLETVGIDFIKGQIKTIPVLCKTIDKKVSGDREQIKQAIAEKIARCWWMFGEGRYEELLHGSDIELLPALFHFEELENKCFNCYNIMIDQDKIEGTEGTSGNLPAEELTRYLNENKATFVSSTYLNYVQTVGGPGRIVFTASEVMPRQAYAISVMPKNKEVQTEFWKTATKIAVGGVVVLGIAAGTFCIVSTAGLCTAAVGALGTVATANTYIGLGILAAPKTAAVIGAAGALTVASGTADILANVYGEREISTINFDYLESGQKMCGSGDLAGN